MSEVLVKFLQDELDSDAYKAQLSKVSAGVSPDRFVTVYKNYLRYNAKSADMLAVLADPENGKRARQTFLSEGLRCAADGLVPDGKEASIQLTNLNVGTKENKVYVKVFQYMPMVAGITKTIFNTGLVSHISTGVIYENDAYDYDMGSQPFVKHRPALKNRGERLAAYASVSLNGRPHPMIEIMDTESINSIRARSKSKDYGPWATDFDEMARKTVLKRLSKRLPRSEKQTEVLQNVLSAVDDDFELDTAPAEQVSESKQAEMPAGLKKVAEAAPTAVSEESINEVF